MIRKNNFLDVLKNNRGVTAVISAIMIFSLIGFAALAIDIGHLYATRNELQNVADAAALAGAGYLGSVYKDLSFAEQESKTFTKEEIAAAVKTIALQNKAAGLNISINDDDITIGKWNPDTKEISPETLTAPDAVEVIARRDDTANSPITTFFSKIFSINTMNVIADATAALTGPSTIAEGELNVPFALSQVKFTIDDCPKKIIFQPENACAGWHDFLDDDNVFSNGTNPTDMTETMLGLIRDHTCDEDYCSGLWNGDEWLTKNFSEMNKFPSPETTPEVSSGDYFEFNNGPLGTLFNGNYLDPDTYAGNLGDIVDGKKRKDPAPFQTLFDYFRYRDGDGNDDIWTATIPIYKEEGTSCLIIPNANIEIVGFAAIEIYEVQPPPAKSLKVDVKCELSVIEGRGGGLTFGGLKGSIPNLVE